jgi:hypothetical protein
MPDVLDEQIEAFEALLPTIRQRHGAAWVLVADRKLVSTFGAFAAAAKYAHEHFHDQQVLIRHTDEKPVESAPFVQVRAAR